MKRLIVCLLGGILCLTGCAKNDTASTETKSSGFTAGTYTGKGTGFHVDVIVDVTVDDTKITDIQVTEQQETLGIGQGMDTTAVEVMPQRIIDAQGLGVDVVTGATISSRAVVSAVTDALTQAGADIDALKTVTSEKKAEDMTYDADVVVVGGGGAGLAAAIEASKAGASVIVVEKQSIVGGATTRSGGKLMAAGTDLQIAAGIDDDADKMYDYLLGVGGDYIDTDKLSAFCDNALDTYNWLETDLNVPMHDVEPIHSSITPNRVTNTLGGGGMTSGFGGNIIVPMYNEAVKDSVQFVYDTTVSEITMDGSTPTGCAGTKADGSKITVNAKSVIIATGGYAANKDLVKSYDISFDSYNTSVPAGNVGDGITMLKAIGAETEDYPAVQVVYTSLTTGVGINEEAGLILSEQGERVANEFTYQYHVGDALAKTNSQKGWYIATANDPSPYVQYAMTLDTTLSAGSIEELAGLMNVDATTLQNTIDHYNELAASGVDSDFGKPAEYMYPVEGDTYYAIELDPCVTVTFSGIVTNTNSQVLNEQGQPIEGVYAAGEVAFPGLFGTEYPGCGVAITGSIYFGRVAGQQAAEFAK